MNATTAPARHHVTWVGTLRGEAVKFFSLRSTWWVLAIGLVLYVVFQWATVWGITDTLSYAGVPPIGDVSPVYLLVLVAGMISTTSAILGALTITSEYSTGMIRSTLTAQPARLKVLSAKLVLLSTVVAVQALLAFLATWGVANPYIRDALGRTVSLTDGTTWKVAGLFVLYTVISAAIGLGLGTILRSTAGGISAALVLLMLVPIILQFMPWDWVAQIRDLLPSNLATAYLSPETGMLGSPQRYSDAVSAVLSAAWAAVLLAVGGVLMVRRDA